MTEGRMNDYSQNQRMNHQLPASSNVPKGRSTNIRSTGKLCISHNIIPTTDKQQESLSY